MDGYNYPGHPVSGVGMMVVLTTAGGVIFAWLRFCSGSVWPSTLATRRYMPRQASRCSACHLGDSLVRAPTGILGLIPMIALALWLAVTNRVTPDTSQQAE